MIVPKSILILEYETVFRNNSPKDISHLISKTTKFELIGLLCYINNQLSPRISARFDYTLKTQKNILNYILRLEPNPSKVDFIFNLLTKETIIFNRPANLWAITDVLNSDLPDDQEESKITSEVLWNFLEFYLCVNSQTNKLKKWNKKNEYRIENLNASTLAHNVYFENINPIFTLYRGAKLINYIKSSQDYGQIFEEYIKEKTDLSLHDYLIEIASIYSSEHNKDEQFRFVFSLNKPNRMFETFSERQFPIKEKYQLEALHIRKAPFYYIGKNQYLLLDDKFLLEKCYELLIWDFLFEIILFDVSEEKAREDAIKTYKGYIGYFFESYVREKIKNSFPYFKHPKPKLFDNLIVNGKELGDIFIRQNKNILFGEVKSSGIPSNSKYGDSLSDLYNSDKVKFFEIHCLNQLVRNLKNLFLHPEKYDDKMNFDKKHVTFPIIITNERALTVGLFIQIFNDQFDTMFKREDFPRHIIKPLQIFHISDLEFLEEYFKEKKLNVFEFLNNHLKKYKIITKLSMSYNHLPTNHGKYLARSISKLLNKNK
ncbi:MAG: hypothetical protein KAT68_19635 [Bacteroidales bacterium]|nr:hypothetical protein [Bacteroidales bacterium]